MNLSRFYKTSPAKLSKSIDDYLNKDYLKFHTPAHAGKANPRDLSEVEGLDDLQNPKEVLLDSQNFIAKLFGAQQSYFLTGGASQGILAAIIALKKYLSIKQDTRPVLLARNVHKSVISGFIQTGLDCQFFEPKWNEDLGLFSRIDFSQLELENYSALIITNPTYEGFYSKVPELKIPLIVDEAHGAHYHFSDKLPEPALNYGADIVIQSWHKCLGSLTQSGITHISKNSKISSELFFESLNLIQSTSPSYLLLESLVTTAETMAENGKEIFAEKIEQAQKYKILDEYPNDDPLRKLIWHNNICGEALDQVFSKKKVMLESTLFNSVLAFINIGNSEEDLFKLKAISEELELQSLNYCNAQLLKEPDFGNQVMNMQNAFNSTSKELSLDESIGKISAELYAPCPPGIPILIPGQEITSNCLSIIKHSQEKDSIKVVK